MAEWDRLLANKARGGGFVGRGAEDETAYYAAFAGEDRTAPAHDQMLLAQILRLIRVARRGLRRIALGP